MARHDIPCAQRVIARRLEAAPQDADALAWRARLLAWSGKWPEAEQQYRALLSTSPLNSDLLLGLADVQIWRGEFDSALLTLQSAATARAAPLEVLSRRAKAYMGLHQPDRAAAAYRAMLEINPSDRSTVRALQQLRAETSRHLLRIGSETDAFSFTNTANLETLSLDSRWTQRWSTHFGGTFTQRFSQVAAAADAGATFHWNRSNWISADGSLATHQDVVATRALAVEYGHGWTLANRLLRGVETYVQQQNLWFTTSRVTTFGNTEVLYFPRSWMLTVHAAAVRTRFSPAGDAWSPSGFARLGFPLARRLGGNVLYGVGAENFFTVDQIGRFSAHLYGGGMKFQVTPMQDLTLDLASQRRTQDRSQFTVAVSYGIRF